MFRSESQPLRRFETYSGLGHLESVAKFLENPEIKVLGIYISKRIKSYRIMGLQITDSPVGIIIKKQDISQVRKNINNGAVINPNTKKIIKNHLSMISTAFTEAEKALRVKKI